MAAPGPAVGFLQEAVRWWDQWLKGRDSGIMNGPMLRAYMQDLMEATRVAAASGQCYDKAMAEVKLPKYENWGGNDSIYGDGPAPQSGGTFPRYGSAPNTTNGR